MVLRLRTMDLAILLLTLVGQQSLMIVQAQNTDAALRYTVTPFVLEIGPTTAITCDSSIAAQVRDIVEGCLDTVNNAECADLFPPSNLPESITLGGAECNSDSEVAVVGGTVDFATPNGIGQQLVDQCLGRIFTGQLCLPDLQAIFPAVQNTVYTETTTPTPTESPTESPSIVPITYSPTQGPTFAPSFAKTGKPSALRSGAPTLPPNDTDDEGVIQRQNVDDDKSRVGLFVGAGACFFCFFFLLILLAARRRRKVKEDKHSDSPELHPPSNKKEELHKADALNASSPSPPPGILHTNSGRRQVGLYLPDQENSTIGGGTSIGDPEFTLVSSVDMASTDDGSESFVDQTRSLNMAISKDMLGGSSEVPKNRNPLISRLGASLTPHLVLSSSSDEGDSQPMPPTRKMVGSFYRLGDDDDDEEESTDDDMLLSQTRQRSHEDFAPDSHWNPDDTEEGKNDAEKGSVFSSEPSSSRSQPLPAPPELKDSSSRRKGRKASSRSILSGRMPGM